MQAGNLFYEADREYTAGNGAGAIGGTIEAPLPPINGSVIAGTDFPDIFWSLRVNPTEYRFDLRDGLYLLTLDLVELTLNGPGMRKLSVVAEGKTLLQDFDIYAYVEKNYALTFRFSVVVSDGQLNVNFPATAGQAAIAGIAVTSLRQDNIPPVVPQSVTALDGYSRNILNWADVSAPDLAGYNVYGAASPAGPFNLLTPASIPFSRYFDDTVPAGQRRYYRLASVDVFGNQSIPSMVVSAIPRNKTQSTLPVHELTVTPENLFLLQSNPDTEDYVPAAFAFDGVSYPGIGVRFRGTSSRTAEKKSWKLNFTRSQPFQNKDKLNLKGALDPSLIRECLASAQFSETAALVGNCHFSHVEVNGEFRGVFAVPEELDELFLSGKGLNDNGKLFEAESPILANFQILPDYSVAWDDDSKDADGFETLDQFIRTINMTPDNAFAATIASVLNVNSYLDYFATYIAMGDMDHSGHNFDMYLNPDSLIWEVIARDFDASFYAENLPIDFGTAANPGIASVHNILTDRLLQVPRFRQWYVNKLDEILLTDFTPAIVGARIDAMLSQVKADGQRDVFKWEREQNSLFLASPGQLKSFVSQRRTFLAREISRYSPGIAQPIMLNEVLAKNMAGIMDEAGEREAWIEVYNPTGNTYNLSGHYLTKDPMNRRMWRIPNGTTVPPRGHLLFWADNEPQGGPFHTNFTIAGTGQAVALYGPDTAGNPLLDVIAFGPQANDISYGRRFDGSSLWAPQSSPSPNTPNTGRRN
jgi:spore coat protein H